MLLVDIFNTKSATNVHYSQAVIERNFCGIWITV